MHFVTTQREPVRLKVCHGQRGGSAFRVLSLASAVAALALAASAQAVELSCDGPSGLFRGTVTAADGTVSEMTLNVFCEGGHYTAQFFTPQGDFKGSDAAYANAHLTAKFDTGVALGKIDLVAGSRALAGTFEDGDDKGRLVLSRVADPLVAGAMTPRLDLTPGEWRQDLRTLAVELPKRHANAFFMLSKGAFNDEVAALDRRVEGASGDEMFVGLQQIAKSIGDGHTGIDAPVDRRVMPIEVSRFGTDFRITAAGPGLESALGARILKIGGVAIDKVWMRALTLTPRGELWELRESNALVYLTRGYALHGLGVTPDRNHATYTLQRDSDGAFDLDVAGLAPGQQVAMSAGNSSTMLRKQSPGEPFWCKDLHAEHAIYCAWRSYQDLKAHARTMFDMFAAGNPEKLIIDMRDNGGGDNTVGFAQIVEPIAANSDINTRGPLYVLVGPQTFSAAMNNAAQLQDQTRAILVGQRIGERPNSYQEPRQFRLPNSHLIVRVSTLWYAFRKHGPNAVTPERTIIPTWEDTRNGRDPALDWVLSQKPN